MKPLSIGAVAFSIATVTLVIGSAFRPNPASRSSIQLLAKQKRAAAGSQKKDTWLYWYNMPQDTYNDYQDWPTEAGELEIELQALVDTNPADDGIEVSDGYMNTWYPHIYWASEVLYVHYD